MNEHVTGDPWPLKETRQQRLEECVDVIRRLHAGEEVTHHGLVTVNQPAEKLTEMLAAYRSEGGKGKAVLQIHLSWAPREEDAVAIALDQWRSNVFAPPIPWDLPTAAHFDGVSADVGEGQVRKSVNVSASLDRHVQWLGEYLDLGFDELYLHFVGQDQAPFIDAFADSVLPQLRKVPVA
jgi:alkanesulfonate monooxygenase SsuD/methylene tetrahydromethanopterin reductase-like flavin-dependent oxidoreductase (luciferase family)